VSPAEAQRREEDRKVANAICFVNDERVTLSVFLENILSSDQNG